MKTRKVFTLSIIVVIILTACIFTAGCISFTDIRAGSQKNTIWISKEPKWIIVVENGITSWVIIDEKKEKVDIGFVNAQMDVFSIDENNKIVTYPSILEGTCEFHKNFFTVKVEKDNLFEEKYRTITFDKLQGYTPDDLPILYSLFGSEK